MIIYTKQPMGLIEVAFVPLSEVSSGIRDHPQDLGLHRLLEMQLCRCVGGSDVSSILSFAIEQG